jgi:hypothetical protein
VFRHMVMFRFADDATDEQKEAMRAGLRRLPEVIPEIVAYRFGDDAGLRDDNFDFGVRVAVGAAHRSPRVTRGKRARIRRNCVARPHHAS